MESRRHLHRTQQGRLHNLFVLWIRWCRISCATVLPLCYLTLPGHSHRSDSPVRLQAWRAPTCKYKVRNRLRLLLRSQASKQKLMCRSREPQNLRNLARSSLIHMLRSSLSTSFIPRRTIGRTQVRSTEPDKSSFLDGGCSWSLQILGAIYVTFCKRNNRENPYSWWARELEAWSRTY